MSSASSGQLEGLLVGAAGPDAELHDWEHDFEPVQEIFVPLYEFVRLTAVELRVLNHPAVQRLRWLPQLGLTSLVYPGATHSRLEHCLGTVHVAQLMIDRLAERLRMPPRPEDEGVFWAIDEPLSPSEVVFTRLAALLHDVSQVPFGHTLEDELGLRSHHDSAGKLREVLTKASWYGEEAAPLAAIIDELYLPPTRSAGFDVRPTEVLLAMLARDAETSPIGAPGIRWAVCQSIVGNTLCADLLDYVHRDRYHIGMPQHFSTRLLSYMEIRRPKDRARSDQPELVLNLQVRHRPRTDAVTELGLLLGQRHQLFEIAYYHRTKLAATAMLERALTELDAVGGGRATLSELKDELYESSDIEFLDAIRDACAMAAKAAATDAESRRLQAAGALVRGVRTRSIHKSFFERTLHQFPPGAAEYVRAMYGGREGRKARLAVARRVEQDLGLAPCSVLVYCPGDLQLKLADVKVYVDDTVRRLYEHEEIVNQGRSMTDLTAGMLTAERTRFETLWRVLVAVSPAAREALGDSEDVLEDLLLAEFHFDMRSRSDPLQQGFELAERVARRCRTSPLFGRAGQLSVDLVGRRRRTDKTVVQRTEYPGGMPSLLDYLPT